MSSEHGDGSRPTTVGDCSRPDIFSLTVDTRRRPQIFWLATAAGQPAVSAPGG
jgi:hypothetical protein